MAGPEDTGVKKSLGDVVEQLQVLNDTMEKMAREAGETGSTTIKQGRLKKIFSWLRTREARKGAKARLAELNQLHQLNLKQAIYDEKHQKEDLDMEEVQLERDKSADARQII